MALKSNRSIFNRDADLKLIELVRTNPVLYNPSQPKYSDIDTRELTWKNIGENLQKPARKCKLRWASIRDMMRKKSKTAFDTLNNIPKVTVMKKSLHS